MRRSFFFRISSLEDFSIMLMSVIFFSIEGIRLRRLSLRCRVLILTSFSDKQTSELQVNRRMFRVSHAYLVRSVDAIDRSIDGRDRDDSFAVEFLPTKRQFNTSCSFVAEKGCSSLFRRADLEIMHVRSSLRAPSRDICSLLSQ